MVKNKINSKVTIIIPTSLGGQKPIDCINSIQKFNYPDQKIKIVLVDNHTSDKTYQKIKQKFPKIGEFLFNFLIGLIAGVIVDQDYFNFLVGIVKFLDRIDTINWFLSSSRSGNPY